MPIKSLISKIQHYFCGIDEHGKHIVLCTTITFFQDKASEDILAAAEAGYLKHSACYTNYPAPILGDWDDATPIIVRIDEYALTQKGVDALKELYPDDLKVLEEEEIICDTWLDEWKSRCVMRCVEISKSLASDEHVNHENLFLLNTCHKYFKTFDWNGLMGRQLCFALLLSYVIEFIARDECLYKAFNADEYYLQAIEEKSGYFLFTFKNKTNHKFFCLRATGFVPTYITPVCEDEPIRYEQTTISTISHAIALGTFLKNTEESNDKEDANSD